MAFELVKHLKIIYLTQKKKKNQNYKFALHSTWLCEIGLQIGGKIHIREAMETDTIITTYHFAVVFTRFGFEVIKSFTY